MAETLRRRSPSEQAAWHEGYEYGLKMGAGSEPPVPGETWAETQARRQRNLDVRPESPSPEGLKVGRRRFRLESFVHQLAPTKTLPQGDHMTLIQLVDELVDAVREEERSA